MNLESLSRRSLLDSVVRISSLPAGMAFFSAWTRAAQQHEHALGSADAQDILELAKYQPQFFSHEDFAAIQAFTEILIPTDETPGAREAYCAQFIDFVLHSSSGYARGHTERLAFGDRGVEGSGVSLGRTRKATSASGRDGSTGTRPLCLASGFRVRTN